MFSFVIKKVFSINWNFYFWGMFVILVSIGITGSSLGWYKSYAGASETISLVGEKKLIGFYRGVRGDEFIAHGTPNAIAQYYHNPQFPKKNNNLGLDGRNFTVIHDLGIPVLHISNLFKPATWGFFIFDLRRALSWYWCFPIFFGIWSINFFLNYLYPKQQVINFFISVAITFSPYSASWSFWPVNNAMGVCLAMGIFLRLFKVKSYFISILFGLIMGWGIGVSAMSLYFPRVWTISILLLFLTIGFLWEEKLWSQLLKKQIILSLFVAIFFVVSILCIWWIENQELIIQIRNSSYPGIRRIYGGIMSWWEFAKGWLAPFSVIKINYSNQCEMQSVLTLFIPFAIYIFIYFDRLKKDMVLWGCCIFVVIALCYQHIGFPEWFADLTLFSSCNPARAGFSLTIAQMLLIAIFFSYRKMATKEEVVSRDKTIIEKIRLQLMTTKGILLIVLISLTSISLFLFSAPKELWQGICDFFDTKTIFCIVFFTVIIYCVSIYYLFRNLKIFAIIFISFNILLGGIFNPICIAPYRIDNHINELLSSQKKLKYQGRTLWCTNQNFLAVAHFLAGGKVFNGYFFYQDKDIFNLLYKDLPNSNLYKRMNHLDVTLVSKDSPIFEATCTHPDRIKLCLNAEKFDFSKLPIDLLVALPEFKPQLENNPSLKKIKYGKHLIFYRVNQKV